MRELPRPISVEEALRGDNLDLNVPDGENITAGPFEPELFESFRLADVTSFGDLYRLGFIPREISEEQMVKAIRADDRAYREALQHHRISDPNASCSCGEQNAQYPVNFHRRQIQEHFIDLLQPLHHDALKIDDTAVIHTYGHMRKWLGKTSRYLIGIYALNNVNIGDDATLTMTPTVQGLYANEINIGNNGRLSFTSGNVHVRCNTLNGPERVFNVEDLYTKYIQGISREVRREQ